MTAVGRFNLLMLEEGEWFLQDVLGSVTLCPTVVLDGDEDALLAAEEEACVLACGSNSAPFAPSRKHTAGPPQVDDCTFALGAYTLIQMGEVQCTSMPCGTCRTLQTR